MAKMKRESEECWNPSRSKKAAATQGKDDNFSEMIRNVRFRAELKTLYVGPALGPLTRSAHNL